MLTPEQEALDARRKRTIWLLAGGAVSLILPLLGVVYLRMSESRTARPPDSSVMFDRREQGDEKVKISQTVTIINPAPEAGSTQSSLPVAGGMTMVPAPGSGSSLDFVKGGENNAYFQDKKTPPAAAPPAAPPPSEPILPPEPAPASKTVAQKSGPKSFNRPKLQGTKTFSSFKGTSPKPTGAPQGMTGIGAPAGAADGDMAEMLKGVPGGANNPEVQKYLKSQGK